jgi:hypothetical protein
MCRSEEWRGWPAWAEALTSDDEEEAGRALAQLLCSALGARAELARQGDGELGMSDEELLRVASWARETVLMASALLLMADGRVGATFNANGEMTFCRAPAGNPWRARP